MARPVKKGLDYFPLDVTLSGSIEYIRCLYGKVGEAVIISLWQRIYENGYFIKYDKMTPLVFSAEFGNQLELCFPSKKIPGWEIYDEIVKKAIELGTFDETLYLKFGILTSKSIQKNYVEAKRKKVIDVIESRYLLLSEPQKKVFVAKTPVIVAKTPVFAETIRQSKVEESKVEKSKVKQKEEKEKEERTPNLELFSAAAARCETEYKKIIGDTTPAVKDGLSKFLSQGMEVELIIRLIQYASERNVKSWQYLKSALKGNLRDGVKTLAQYNAMQKRRKKKSCGGKFHNYTDTNRIDYGKYEKQVYEQMLSD